MASGDLATTGCPKAGRVEAIPLRYFPPELAAVGTEVRPATTHPATAAGSTAEGDQGAAERHMHVTHAMSGPLFPGHMCRKP